jgi:hypothetical protein
MFPSWSRLRWIVAAPSLAVAATFLASDANAQLPTTQLTSVFPAGGKVGAKVEVAVTGDNLDEADAILFSHAGITAVPKMNEPLMPGKAAKPAPNQFTVTIAADVPAGIYEARVKGRFGLSNPRTFMIGTAEEALEVAGNNDNSKAQELAVGTVMNGHMEANSRDFYKVTLKAGERVMIDCRAGALDSQLDPTVAVINTAGRELARGHDGSKKDAVIDFTVPAEGVYLIVLNDFLYGGGPQYAYRLLLHKAPLIDFVFPPAAQAGTQGAFTVYGRNLPGGQPAGISLGSYPLEKVSVTVPVPADVAGLPQAIIASQPRTSFIDAFEYRLASPNGASNPVALGVATEPVIAEVEPNNTPDKAQKLTVPCELAGQFYPARDRDLVQFDAKKGEVYTIEVIAHRLGLDSDPALTVQRVTKNDKGEEVVTDVAQVDDPQERQTRIGGDFDTSTDDASFRLAVTEDSTYRVLVRDNFGESRTDPRCVYRLVIRKERPDFRLAVYLDPPGQAGNPNISLLSAPVLRKGGTLELRVSLDRRDNFTGEVTVSVEGLPAGITCPGAVVGGQTESASLVLTAADTIASWSGPIKIVGKATINGAEVIRPARMGTCVVGTADRQQRPPEFRLARDLVLSVMDKEMQPALVVVGEDKVYETSRGANFEIPVKVTRREGFADAIKLTKANLPAEIPVKELNVAAGAADGKLEMQLNQQNVKAGTYTFYLKGETKLKYARNPDAIKAIEADAAEFVEMQKMLQEALTKATADKTTATQQAQQAVTEKNQAEQNKNTLNQQSQQAATNAQTAAANAVKAKEAAAANAADANLAAAATAAQKQADDAAAAAKVAADKAAEGEKALVAAQEKVKVTEEAKVKADAAATEAQTKVTQAAAQKQQLDQQVNKVKQDNQPKDVQIQFASTPIKLRIVETPVKFTLGAPALALKTGEKTELPITIERGFGYAEPVEITAEFPNGLGGFNVQKIDIPKDQTQGKLTFAPDANAPAGDHTITIRARARWNNVQCESTLPLALKLEKPPAAAK